MSENYVLLSEKRWHEQLFVDIAKLYPTKSWSYIHSKNNFGLEILETINPSKIFIPHWSYIIPSKIYERFECIVFHMTDLPYGRGGSPLQNLIIRSHHQTKISAIRVAAGVDTGNIYLKKDLDLSGTAQEIFSRSSLIIKSMIQEIIDKNIEPKPQKGEVLEFTRRKPEDSNLSHLDSIDRVYDYIRMLDCEGYPPAYIETEHFRFEFTKAEKHTQEIEANVRIFKK